MLWPPRARRPTSFSASRRAAHRATRRVRPGEGARPRAPCFTDRAPGGAGLLRGGAWPAAMCAHAPQSQVVGLCGDAGAQQCAPTSVGNLELRRRGALLCARRVREGTRMQDVELLLARLDWLHPGLADAARRWEAGDQEGALAAVIAHFRGRRSPTYLFDESDIAGFGDREVIAEADEVVAHTSGAMTWSRRSTGGATPPRTAPATRSGPGRSRASSTGCPWRAPTPSRVTRSTPANGWLSSRAGPRPGRWRPTWSKWTRICALPATIGAPSRPAFASTASGCRSCPTSAALPPGTKRAGSPSSN